MDDKEKIKFIEAIKKTGFDLERRISLLLESKGWTLINNRFYLDDSTEALREIDIIAYKTFKVESIICYNTLIISCKKSEKNVWSFLTKPVINSMNTNLFPVNTWSNSKILLGVKYEELFIKHIKENIGKIQCLKELFVIEKNIFAFQEILQASNNYKANNDSNIFGSITSVIKALAYELSILENRKKGVNTLYNFDLLSIFDGRMVEYDYKFEDPELKDINEIRYINRYIINKLDNHYRIQFISFNKLNNYLEAYDEYIQEQKIFYESIITLYREKFKSDYSVRNIFTKEIKSDIQYQLYSNTEPNNYKIELESLAYNNVDNILQLELNNATQNDITNLNMRKDAISIVTNIIKNYTLYNGKIEFTQYEEFVF